MAELSTEAARLLKALRDAAEGCEEVNDDGSVWQDVYLDNATTGFPARSIPGLLNTPKHQSAP